MPFKIITLDGAAASGKSSTAKGLAKKLGFLYVETGSHYRAITALLLKHKVKPEEAQEVVATLGRVKASAKISGMQACLLLEGVVAKAKLLRSPEVNASVSRFAALPAVREYLLEYQRSHVELARRHGFSGLIMEGRDIGSVVFPDTPYKFFLQADSATRSQRRKAEGQEDTIALRDKLDSERSEAPLVVPDGALIINTAVLSLSEVIDRIAEIVAASKYKAISKRLFRTSLPIIDKNAVLHSGFRYEGRSHHYSYLQVLFTALLEQNYGFEPYGMENIPNQGAFILAANHASFLDSPAIGARLFRALYFFGRKTVFKHKFLAWWLNRLNFIKLDRERGSDLGALRTVIKTLQEGYGVQLFPEGTRSPDGKLQPGKQGVSFIACQAEVPIIPVRLFGNYHAWNRHRVWPRLHSKVHIVYGRPFWLQKSDSSARLTKEDYIAATDSIMASISSIQEPKEMLF